MDFDDFCPANHWLNVNRLLLDEMKRENIILLTEHFMTYNMIRPLKRITTMKWKRNQRKKKKQKKI